MLSSAKLNFPSFKSTLPGHEFHNGDDNVKLNFIHIKLFFIRDTLLLKRFKHYTRSLHN
jgi:hypothetical protein